MSLFPVLLSDVTVMGQRYTEIGGALFCQWMLAFLSIFFQPYTRQLVYSIVTSLSCVGIFNNHCYKFTTKLTVNEFWKTVSILQRYGMLH